MTTEAWESYPRAPSRGTALCAVSAVPLPGTLSLDLGGFPILLVSGAAGLRAFVNACPHQFLPLDTRSDRVLSVDGTTLRCSNHDAGFDADSGQGIDGHGQGCELDAIPVVQRDGWVVIAGDDRERPTS